MDPALGAGPVRWAERGRGEWKVKEELSQAHPSMGPSPHSTLVSPRPLLNDTGREVPSAPPPSAQAAQAVSMAAVGQDAEDPLGLRLGPHLVHADATHDVLTVLHPLQPQAGSEHIPQPCPANTQTHTHIATPNTVPGPQGPPPAGLGTPEAQHGVLSPSPSIPAAPQGQSSETGPETPGQDLTEVEASGSSGDRHQQLLGKNWIHSFISSFMWHLLSDCCTQGPVGA